MSNNIEGKVIVITGASSGLGEAATRLLADQGAKVVLAARRTERLEKITEDIQSKGGAATYRTVDVRKLEQVKQVVDYAVNLHGRIDVMLNNAGVMPLSPLEELKLDEWNRMVDINIKGVLNGIAAALPYFKKQKAGHFINVSSVNGHKAGPGSAVYSATKAAVLALSEGLRLEVKPYNVRTTVISPGAVATELRNSISDKEYLAGIDKAYKDIDIPATSFADMISFAISQPDYVDINEILFRPVKQEW
ncbi:MAG TPA: SDR family oxidoreductase [Flavisolibacter sp.]|nr:SDR family oxidoreductase [Flavisolibacter sp.]